MAYNGLAEFIEVKMDSGCTAWFRADQVKGFGTDFFGTGSGRDRRGFVRVDGETHVLRDDGVELYGKMEKALREIAKEREKKTAAPACPIPEKPAGGGRPQVQSYEAKTWDEWLDSPIKCDSRSMTPVSTRLANALGRAGYDTWRQVDAAKDDVLWNCRNVSKANVKCLRVLISDMRGKFEAMEVLQDEKY